MAIFVSSSLTAPPSPPQQLTDKHVHGVVYAGFALTLVRATAGGTWAGVTAATAGKAAAAGRGMYGATDEWHQSFVPGRDADVRDLVADAVGAALAVAVVGAMARWGRRAARADGTIEQAAGRTGQAP